MRHSQRRHRSRKNSIVLSSSPPTLTNCGSVVGPFMTRGTTVDEAFQAMEEDLCTTDAQHQLTRELTKKMNALSYTPSPIGPKEYFRQLTKYQHQINLLPETANVTEAQMIDYSREAFAHSKHDPITLHQVDEDWKKHRGQRLKELYSSYHNNSSTANLADVQTNQRFAEIESKQRDLANACHEIYSQVTETATAASTMTMSNQWEKAMAVLQADTHANHRVRSGNNTNIIATCVG
eukprot:jgi/Psemu1/61428/gm1.61428_g